jgi:signal transduction histidine kinase
VAEEQGPLSPSSGSQPAERVAPEALAAEVAAALSGPIVDALLQLLPGAVAVLNERQQVVALNASFLAVAETDDPGAALGLRVGEVLGCDLADDGPDGCGTGPACSSCGMAVAQAAAAARLRPEERSCTVSVTHGGQTQSLDLRVRAAPLDLGGRRLAVVALTDISAERRRAALERAFFHDLTNLVSGLQGASGALDDPDLAEAASAITDVRLLTRRLGREVQLQRALASQRAGVYRVAVERVPVAGLVEQLRLAFQQRREATGKALTVALPPAGGDLDTDGFLLHRVVTSMLANAFEATPAGGEVRLSVEAAPAEVVFRAWNAGAIPAAIQGRVFQRFFSTKPGEGRGQGTYMMKLFGEAYLKGRVGFTTSAEGGTTFEVRLPRTIGTPVPPWARGATRA